jgi:hypothetical protein
MKTPGSSASPAALPGSNGRQWLAKPWLWLTVILGGSLAVLFFQSFQPDWILFVNDATLGQMTAAPNRLPGAFTGEWHWASWVGVEGMAQAPTLSALLALVFSPEIYLKIYAPFSLFFAGFCAWVFFRQLEFNPAVCLLGGVATGLNMHFFSTACWGLGVWNMAAGMIFLALAALCAKSIPQIWAKGILAGLAVGLNLMEGFDVGAILSVYVGLFILWRIFTQEEPGVRKVLTAFGLGALVIFFSALIAAHTLSSLVGTQVEGIVWASANQQSETKEQRWDPATQWSLPKIETLRMVVPGLFGYRMTGWITAPDKSSAYWGSVGEDTRLLDIEGDNPEKRAKAIETFIVPAQLRNDLDSSDRQTRLNAIHTLTGGSKTAMRYSAFGEYGGVLVSILALFALVNSWRGTRAPYSHGERRAVWFWGGAALFSLLAAWGRYAFFYRLIYQLPCADTIRNPIKFLHPFHIALLILAAYGLEALWRQYLQTAARTETLPLHLQAWWAKVSGFEKKWTVASLALAGASLAALFIYGASKPRLIEYLVQKGFDANEAVQIAGFSVAEACWFIVWLFVSAGVIVGVISGAWGGSQARLAWIFIGAIIILDLARSDKPWIRYFNYKQEYAGNSVVDFLQEKPHEHRAIGRVSPRGLGAGLGSPFGQLYNYWQQNDFPYHNIQTLDFAQWLRTPLPDAAYMKNFALRGDDIFHCDLWPAKRLWKLTNTRYILSFAILPQMLNQQAEAGDGDRLRIKTFLKMEPKPGVTTIEDDGDMTVVPVGQGDYALIEFTNALPRAKLYSHWESPANDDATLQTLASHEFDPEQTVLVAGNTPVGQPPGNSKLNAGAVSITDYQPKHVTLQANAATPAVLLLNDRIAPAWKVRVDQKPAPLLRCNYLMRGVFLTPGEHTVEFRYQPPLTMLYLSLCGWGIGILAAGYLIYSRSAV